MNTEETNRPERTLTVEEVAGMVDRGPQTVRRWIKQGYIKAVRIGREYRISKADLNAWWRGRGGGVLFPEAGFPEATEGAGE